MTPLVSRRPSCGGARRRALRRRPASTSRRTLGASRPTWRARRPAHRPRCTSSSPTSSPARRLRRGPSSLADPACVRRQRCSLALGPRVRRRRVRRHRRDERSAAVVAAALVGHRRRAGPRRRLAAWAAEGGAVDPASGLQPAPDAGPHAERVGAMPTVSADDIVAGRAGGRSTPGPPSATAARSSRSIRWPGTSPAPSACRRRATSAPTGDSSTPAALRRRFEALGVPERGAGHGVLRQRRHRRPRDPGARTGRLDGGGAVRRQSWSGWIADPVAPGRTLPTYWNRHDRAGRREDPLVIERMEAGDRVRRHRAGPTVATTCARWSPVLLGDDLPMHIECWDGSAIAAPAGDPVGTLRLVSPDAVRRLLWSPNELGLGPGPRRRRARPRRRPLRGRRRSPHRPRRRAASASVGRRGRRRRRAGCTCSDVRFRRHPRRPISAAGGTRCVATPPRSATTTTSATTSTASCSARR